MVSRRPKWPAGGGGRDLLTPCPCVQPLAHVTGFLHTLCDAQYASCTSLLHFYMGIKVPATCSYSLKSSDRVPRNDLLRQFGRQRGPSRICQCGGSVHSFRLGLAMGGRRTCRLHVWTSRLGQPSEDVKEFKSCVFGLLLAMAPWQCPAPVNRKIRFDSGGQDESPSTETIPVSGAQLCYAVLC
jgi:hypothetical protein